MSNSEAIPLLGCQSLSPNPVGGDLVIKFSDENPVCPALKRGADPFGIDSRGSACRHLWIRVVATEVVTKRSFVYVDEDWQVRVLRTTNLQLSVTFRETNFFDRCARKIEDEIQQRVHEQKAALFQGVNCGQFAGLDPADHTFCPAVGESLDELAGQRAENFDACRSIAANGEMLHGSNTPSDDVAVPRRIVVNDESADPPGGQPPERDASFLRQTLADFIKPVGQALVGTQMRQISDRNVSKSR